LRPGVFWRGVARSGGDVDGASPCSSLAPEADLYADLAQDGGRPAQPSRQCPRAIWLGPGCGRALTHHLCKGAQKIRGSSRPHRPHRPRRCRNSAVSQAVANSAKSAIRGSFSSRVSGCEHWIDPLPTWLSGPTSPVNSPVQTQVEAENPIGCGSRCLRSEWQVPDIFQNPPKSGFRGTAHGSIRIQEGEPSGSST
jgi:hypothetical protein